MEEILHSVAKKSYWSDESLQDIPVSSSHSSSVSDLSFDMSITDKSRFPVVTPEKNDETETSILPQLEVNADDNDDFSLQFMGTIKFPKSLFPKGIIQTGPHEQEDPVIQTDAEDAGSVYYSCCSSSTESSQLEEECGGSETDPEQYVIEEWHGCRVNEDGEKEYFLKWEGYTKKQWINGDFLFKEGNATDAALEELLDKCNRFPDCPACQKSQTPHTCWEISQYVDCEGVYDRRQHDGIHQYKVRWSSNGEEAWIVAGQFDEPSWTKIKQQQQDVSTIMRLKAAVSFKSKQHRKKLPYCTLASSKGTSKRRNSSETVNSKRKRQKTAPRKATELPSNPAPFFAGGAPLQMGNQIVKDIVLQSQQSLPTRNCLASCFFEGRLRPTSRDEKQSFPATLVMPEMGESWKLLYVANPAKAKKVYLQNKFIPQQNKPLKVYYVAVQVKNEEKSSDLQHELEKLGDFSSLTAEKVIARLKLLFTDAKPTNYVSVPHCIFATPPSIYSEIEERGNEGCGFFSRALFLQLFDDESKQRKFKDVVAIQVRIVCPNLGIFKGVLVLKDDPCNLVELPSSMRKVLPSKHDDLKDNSALLIKHTFPSKANVALEKYWATGHITASDTKVREQGLKGGIEKFLSKAFKMKDSSLQKILADSKKLDTIQHANVVGVADCTGAIPAGMVYLSGFHRIPNFQAALQRKAVFVCRHPCVERADARRLSILTDKPSHMSQSHWKFLQSLPFGVIMFGFTEGRCSIPPQIANGDLDGDLYFVSWDSRLLDLDLIPISTEKCAEESQSKELNSNPNWLEAAHELMTDVKNSEKYCQLMSKFHRLWDESKNDLDEAEFCLAYKMSLDIEKHGGKIILPRHSWDELHRRLHSSLQEPECAEINSILRDLFLSTVDEAERSELCRAYKESLDIKSHGGTIRLPKRWWANIPQRFRFLLRDPSPVRDAVLV